MKLLITEDYPKHLQDAREMLHNYAVEVAYAETEDAGLAALRKDGIDAVITDIFLPRHAGGEPTYLSGLCIAQLAHSKGIPFVYNSAGNHHGSIFAEFRRESEALWREYGFGSGKVIEAYPATPNGSKDTKQWAAAINYALLLSEAKDFRHAQHIGELLSFAHYGDYGKLTSRMKQVLDPEETVISLTQRKLGSIHLEPLWVESAIREWMNGNDERRYSMNNPTYDLIDGKFISLLRTKEEDEQLGWLIFLPR
jgi:CheY-like chemotaxis protein